MLREFLGKVLPEPVKVIIRKIILYLSHYSYLYHTRRLARNADINRPVEVAVFIMIAENWNSFESVYRCIKADKRINITVYVFPGHVFTDTPEKLNLKLYGEVLAFFAERGISVVKAYDPENDTWLTPEAVKADYVFYDEPYEIYPPQFSFDKMYKRAKLCHIPYGYILTKSEYMLNKVLPLLAFRFIYAFFANSDYVADHVNKDYGKILRKYHHVMRLGFPRFDLTCNVAEFIYGGGGLQLSGIPVSH